MIIRMPYDPSRYQDNSNKQENHRIDASLMSLGDLLSSSDRIAMRRGRHRDEIIVEESFRMPYDSHASWNKPSVRLSNNYTRGNMNAKDFSKSSLGPSFAIQGGKDFNAWLDQKRSEERFIKQELTRVQEEENEKRVLRAKEVKKSLKAWNKTKEKEMKLRKKEEKQRKRKEQELENRKIQQIGERLDEYKEILHSRYKKEKEKAEAAAKLAEPRPIQGISFEKWNRKKKKQLRQAKRERENMETSMEALRLEEKNRKWQKKPAGDLLSYSKS